MMQAPRESTPEMMMLRDHGQSLRSHLLCATREQGSGDVAACVYKGYNGGSPGTA